MIGKKPSQEVVNDHLALVEARNAGPSWDRGTLSLELLLGLRSQAVDEKLLRLAPTRADDGSSIGGSLLAKAASTPTIERIALLISERASALSLAWLTATREEVVALANTILPRLRTPRMPGVWDKALFAALCEHAAVTNASSVFSDLENVANDEWVKTLCLSRAKATPPPTTTFFDSPIPAWSTEFPAALIRDGLTGALSRAVLLTNPHRHRLSPSNWRTLPCFGLLYVDVDRMKQICDVYGLPAGDAVLVALAEHLQRLFGDRVLRFGGEEFLVLCDEQDLPLLAQHVVESVATLEVATPYTPSESLRFTVSVGAAHGELDEKTVHVVEDALHHAKQSGRNRFSIGKI